jgi:hypothetical protein
MGILSGNPTDEPMHYGEVFGVWSALSVAKASHAAYQVYYNHTGDADLKKLIDQIIKNNILPCIEELETLLKKNEVGLPPTPPERPNAKLEEIPAGARISDPEVAMSISKDLAQGLVADSTMIGQCIREDIALLFTQHHAKKVQYGGKILQLNKEKGWLIPPPLHLDK